MIRRLTAIAILSGISVLPAILFGQDASALVKKIQEEIARKAPVEKIDSRQLRGEMLSGSISSPRNYPGTKNAFQVYVPREYTPAHAACVLLKLDGLTPYEAAVLDELIETKEMPVTIGVGLSPGTVLRDESDPRALRFDRSYEFDSVNDRFPEFVIEDLLPAVEKMRTQDGRPIVLSKSGNDRAVMGASTGGIGSFTLAWRRPDQFTRVYSEIGTFVSMRGGNEYAALIRKTDPKPIRVFLEDGSTDAWNPLFGSWFDANLNMDSALIFGGYDEAHAWGEHGHDSKFGQAVLPDVMRWLWRNYPAPIKPGRSQNSTLQEVALEGEGWQEISTNLKDATTLAADTKGDVYVSDYGSGTIYRISTDGQSAVFHSGAPIISQVFGQNSTLYGLVPAAGSIIAINSRGETRTIVPGVTGRHITGTHKGALYVSEPGEHPDVPSHIWQISRTGERKLVDQGLSSVSGLVFSPDRALFFAAEASSKWIYSYVVKPDGTFTDKQPFDWLHTDDITSVSGSEDLAADKHGNLYVATRIGIQICDQNGRVRAILPLPVRAGSVRSICFGGEHFDSLYATDGNRIFRRRLKISGVPPWADPIAYPSTGPG
jgi:gluconolactonase